MLQVRLEAQGSQRELALAGPRCMIGKDAGCDIVIPGWKVSRRHAELFVASDRVYIRDLDSTFGTFVNEERVSGATVVQAGDRVRIGSHGLEVAWSGQGEAQDDAEDSGFAASAPAPLAAANGHANGRVSGHANGHANEHANGHAAKPSEGHTPAADLTYRYRRLLHEKLLEAFDVRRTDTHRMADEDLRELTERLIGELMLKLGDELPEGLDRRALLEQVRDEAIGLGPLEPLLADQTITEIMVNRCDEVFVERAGQLQRWPVNFTSDRAVQGIIERIVAPIGRRIDESSPMVDARLKDGSRVNAVIPPLALKGPSITIRKFSKRKLDSSDLLKFGSASPAMIEFLRVCVVHQKNMLISGGTGSGKTTLLNILSNFIPDDERIVTIEDAAELQLHHTNVVSLEARPANVEGKGAVPIRELVKNSLRMRPDRIVVGECRGGEALDMLQAMNTGHDGSLTTAHANSPRDMLARLEVMVLMAGMDLPVTAIREQIASAVDIVVQQTRFACGTRKITSITEVTGVESGKIQLQEVFAFVQTGRDTNNKTVGKFVGRGAVPEFYEELAAVGVPLDMAIFDDVQMSGVKA
ncbi:Flp pilus assembly complex ATPase component TadA [Pelomonas sp. P7]|uniref:Flp pilus assembly complex ATPase component TadA n=1 Tax=Pelomonas caseinilytica TaxID=2906763 RepID=A0ABS8XCL1_9BURK|nr:ATPase, T2SS/T4P/T4SS family [Pelomonas sp. P7]MCE4537127.1 Flp pilus assembly complex ATPase component TadA [Pelomonas sp. P7]